jgi:hypothetical protein
MVGRAKPKDPATLLPEYSDGPATFHITHHKAGSQWILAIMRRLLRPQVVKPQQENRHVLEGPLEEGKIYPTAYINKAQFDALELPGRWQRFIVIRDLRDAFVSGYWSWKLSHPKGSVYLDPAREQLQAMSLHEGLMWLMDTWRGEAEIVRSWMEVPDEVVRYEDLLEDDVGILVPLLTEKLGLVDDPGRAERIIVGARFDQMTKGRERGSEDVTAHNRKGVAGDWRNYIVGPVADKFKDLYGQVLIDSGYETDLDW